MNLIVFGQGGGGPGAPMDFSFILIMMAMFAVFYFIWIRPQRKKQQELKTMIEALKKGDRVMTNGGIFGTVQGIKDTIVVLKIAEEVKIEIVKSAIASVVEKKAT